MKTNRVNAVRIGQRYLLTLVFIPLIAIQNAASAQPSSGWHARVGVGTFLTRDRGWNYHQSFELFGALERDLGSALTAHAGAAVLIPTGRWVKSAVYPFREGALRSGFAARFHVRSQPRGLGLLGIAGVEAIHNTTEEETSRTAIGPAAGLGLGFGRVSRSAITLRYVALTRRLGSSRGILALDYDRRF